MTRSPSSRRTFRPQFDTLECRTVPAAGFTRIPDDAVPVGPDDGGTPQIRIVDPATGTDVDVVQAYEDGFRGGVRTALGDVTGDHVPDLVIAPGVGGGPRIRIVDGATGATVADFFVYEPSFLGGLYVAVGDVNHDGKGDIITGTGDGGGPRVRVLDGATLGRTVLKDFFAYEDSFRGGVLVAAGDVDGDGADDVITGTGVGGGPRVIAFDLGGRVLQNFFAYEDSFRGGVLVASGDVDGNGRDDIIAGTGPGGGPVVRVVGGLDGRELARFLADDSAFRGGVAVGAGDVNGDGRDDVIARTRHGNDVLLQVFDDRGGAFRSFTRTVDDNPSAGDLAEGGSGGISSGSSGNGSGGTTTTVASQVEGTVEAVDPAAGTVTIRQAGGTRVVVKTNAGTRIKRNGAGATFSAFRAGDFAQAELGSDGFALILEATGPA